VADTPLKVPVTAAAGLTVTGLVLAATAAGLIHAAAATIDTTRAALERANNLGTEVLPPLAAGPLPADDCTAIVTEAAMRVTPRNGSYEAWHYA
jgi:hypothetical protein